jgi:IS1 family transposase
MGWALVNERTVEAIQNLVDQVPNTFQFCSDGYAAYSQVNYRRSRHLVARGKSQTYSVEANNAELRCFVSQLVRRTRRFAKSAAGFYYPLRALLERSAVVQAALSQILS